MSNGIRATTMKRDGEFKVVVQMYLDGKDSSWIEFNEEQLRGLLATLQTQHKVLCAVINHATPAVVALEGLNHDDYDFEKKAASGVLNATLKREVNDEDLAACFGFDWQGEYYKSWRREAFDGIVKMLITKAEAA